MGTSPARNESADPARGNLEAGRRGPAKADRPAEADRRTVPPPFSAAISQELPLPP
jgi:hypothetical protein